MAAEYILPLADPRATLALTGGKGASLARLSQAGLPVPDGFHLTTAAYLDFVAENHLQERILVALAAVDPANYATLDTASQAIGELFQNSAMPAAIEAAITRAYAGLPGEDPLVAVRSSATAEDLPGLSFAGQQETYLNVHGIASVLVSVKSCWASLWTARAIGYRARHAIPPGELSLAVVIQLLVRADASGVLFTANPATGRRDQVMITAAWGLGEAIVGGLVTPDTLTVNKASGQVIERLTARKEVHTVLLDSGTQEQPLPETLRTKAVLSDEQAAELAGLGMRIEALYGTPMDIEWTLAGGQFAIVQARPVTALPPNGGDTPEEPVEPPSGWKMPDPHGVYGRGSITEQLPGPLTPLFASLAGPIIDQETRRMYREYMGVKNFKSAMFDTINDYAYLNMSFGRWAMVRMVLSSVAVARRMLHEAESRYRAARQHYVEEVQRYQARPLADYAAVELLEGARQLTRLAVSLYTVLQTGVIPGASTSEMLFTQTYNRLIKKSADPQAPVFLMGFESTPIRAEQAFFDLAEWVRSYPGLVAHLAATPAAQLAAGLDSAFAPQAPDNVEPEVWGEWQRRFACHLANYGHSTYDMDFSRSVAADDPAPLLETLRMYLLGKAGSPYARVQALAGRREQATVAMLKRLRWPFRSIFLKQLRNAQKNAPLREDGLSDLGLGYPQLRRMLRELGARLALAGMFTQADDVFWLYQDELERVSADLDHAPGEPLVPVVETIRQRKAFWKAEQRLVAPVVLPPGAKFLGLDVEKLSAARASDDVNVIKGFGASQGKVTATARVLLGPQDFGQMQSGDVLVAPLTTPAWTPLFAMASAIVTDIGGPLSHSSIVAREYGLPAVLGTGVATRRIRSGQRITVDGSAGSVTLETSEL